MKSFVQVFSKLHNHRNELLMDYFLGINKEVCLQDGGTRFRIIFQRLDLEKRWVSKILWKLIVKQINGFLITTCNTLATDRNFSYLLAVFVNKNFKEILGSQNTLKPKLREVIRFSEFKQNWNSQKHQCVWIAKSEPYSPVNSRASGSMPGSSNSV